MLVQGRWFNSTCFAGSTTPKVLAPVSHATSDMSVQHVWYNTLVHYALGLRLNDNIGVQEEVRSPVVVVGNPGKGPQPN